MRFGIAHAKYAKDGKKFLFLKNLCDLRDRSVRFRIGTSGFKVIKG